MNKGVLKFCKEIKGQAVNVLQGETLKSIIIYYQGGGQQALAKAPIHPIPKVVIKVPALFRYSSDKAVPWNYTNQVTSQEPRAIRVSPEMNQEPFVNDIVGTGGLTRSGRCYAPSPLGVKKREKGIEQSDVEVIVSKKKGKESLNEPVTETEANESLKFIKHSEYLVRSLY